MEKQNFEDSRVKHEPPVEFVLILPRPTFGWPAIKQEKDVKPKRIPSVRLTKFDAKWKSKPKLFQAFHTCLHCQHVVKFQRDLTRHLRACSKIIPAGFWCDMCGKGFPQKRLIWSHMLKHSNSRKFCCTKCGVRFDTKTYLLRHKRVKKIHKCAVCDVKFSCKVLLDRHRRDFHGNIFKCDKCSYQTKVERDFMKHKGTHDKLFACESCQKKFSTIRHLKVHQMQHRHGIYATAPEETFNCDKCDKSFSSLRYLRLHQRNMHDEKEVKCKVCLKICRNLRALHQHSQAHKKVECSICHRMISKYELASHLRSHSRENHFKCDLCGHSTKTKPLLKKHIERMHLLKKLVNDSKCREDFNEFELLEKLQLEHGSSATTSEKKFECDRCTKAFVTPGTLNQHKKTVHTDKLFDCHVCKKAYKARSDLNRHRAKAHLKK